LVKNKNIGWVYAGAILFIVLNAIFTYKEFYYFSIFPVVLLLVAAAFLSLDKLLLAIVFFVPLSVPLSELVEGLPIDMFLPTEPLLAGILLIFIIKILFEKQFDKKVLFHPVSLVIYFYLGWMLITTVTSSMPVVSIKFFVSRLWFIVAFFFLGTQLFRQQKNVKQYVLLYAYAFLIVIVYALVRHAKYGIFDEKIAHWASNPFYKDHTSYGAMLAFYIPTLIALMFYKKYTPKQRSIYAFLTTMFFIAIIFSYSRAAWVSLIGAFGVWVLIKLRIRFSVILLGAVLIAAFFMVFGTRIMLNLEKNRQDSSTTSLSKHIESISNVSTDASNLERLNRWNCALRMFKERPVFGWGPGTYMFQYAPFQVWYEKTIISTNEGNMGNAHSEYLGPLAEQGLPGTLLYVLLLVVSVITGLRALKRTRNKEIKMLGLSALLGLFTYFIHGFLNNFLDTDKASVPFWGFIGLMVAIDLYYRNEKEQKTIE